MKTNGQIDESKWITPHFVKLQKSPIFFQTIKMSTVVVSKCLSFKVFKNFRTELDLQSVAIKPKQTLQTIPKKCREEDNESMTH